MIKLKNTLFYLLLMQLSLFSQTEKTYSKKDIIKAKHIKYCKKINIIIDPLHYIYNNSEKRIKYQVITTHERNQQTFQYKLSFNKNLSLDEIDANLFQITTNNTTCYNIIGNEIVVKNFFNTSTSDSLVVSAFIKQNHKIKNHVSVNLFSNKLIPENLWINSPYINSNNEIQVQNTDSNIISLYFKYLPVNNRLKTLHLTAINHCLKDTLRFIVDTTSFLQLSYNPDYRLKVYADVSINPNNLNVRLTEIDNRNDYSQEYKYQKDDRDKFMVMKDENHERLLKLEANEILQSKFKNSMLIGPLPNYLFK